jgi:hypothetical protein
MMIVLANVMIIVKDVIVYIVTHVVVKIYVDVVLRTLNRKRTAVETLLTFCPPGPDDRIKSSLISFSLIAIVGVMAIIFYELHHIGFFLKNNCTDLLKEKRLRY